MCAALPVDSRVLTPRGWIVVAAISGGDEVMGLDTGASKLTWTRVCSHPTNEVGTLASVENKFWSARVSPHHPWWGAKHVDRGKLGMRWQPRSFNTDQLTPRHRIIIAAPAEIPARLDIAERDAAVVAWLLTDGHIVRSARVRRAPSQAGGRRVHFCGSIFQKKVKQVADIDQLLRDVEHSRFVRPIGIVQWALRPAFLRELWARARLDEYGLDRFVLALSTESRRSFVDACLSAEGWVDQDGTRGFAQNTGEVLEAMRLAWFLDGNFISSSHQVSYTGKVNVTLRATKSFVTGQRLHRRVLGTSRGLSSLATALGTVVTRQDDRIMVTGAVPPVGCL